MQTVLQQIEDWLRGLLVGGIMDSLSGVFDAMNQQVADVATEVGSTLAAFSPGVFSMIRNVSDSVILPIAGMILTFVACYELIQMIVSINNMQNFESWIFFKWLFKTCIAVLIVSNTWNITMAVFDVAQHVIRNASGVISGSTAVDDIAMHTMQATLESMEVGELIGVYLQSFLISICMWIMSRLIFVIVYG